MRATGCADGTRVTLYDSDADEDAEDEVVWLNHRNEPVDPPSNAHLCPVFNLDEEDSKSKSKSRWQWEEFSEVGDAKVDEPSGEVEADIPA
ncbi:unnamed protein product [Cutaneotrichosporon oleaginosum]